MVRRSGAPSAWRRARRGARARSRSPTPPPSPRPTSSWCSTRRPRCRSSARESRRASPHSGVQCGGRAAAVDSGRVRRGVRRPPCSACAVRAEARYVSAQRLGSCCCALPRLVLHPVAAAAGHEAGKPARLGFKALHEHCWCWGGCWRVTANCQPQLHVYVCASQHARWLQLGRFFSVAWYR